MIRAPNLNDLTETDLIRRDRINQAKEILIYKVWFEYKKASEIFDEFDIAYIQACDYFNNPEANADIRPISLVLSGEINTGKTTLVRKYINYCYKIAEVEVRQISEDDIKYFETPVRVTFKRMFAAILEEFGVAIKPSVLRSTHTDVLINMIIEELKTNKVKLLFLDEIQNLLQAELEDKRDIFNGLKKLTNQSQTRLILVGTPQALKLFKEAQWVDERFRVLTLPRWDYKTKEWLDLLSNIYTAYKDFFPKWDLITKEGKVNKSRSIYLYNLSGGRLGKLIQTIQQAAVHAILNNKENITKEDYEAILPIKYYVKDGKIEIKKTEKDNINQQKEKNES